MGITFCQSCGMPLTNPEETGTEKNGEKSTDYCIYCYKNGRFTDTLTMDQMIDRCGQFLVEYNKDAEKKLTLEEAKEQMREFFPKLKRWKN